MHDLMHALLALCSEKLKGNMSYPTCLVCNYSACKMMQYTVWLTHHNRQCLHSQAARMGHQAAPMKAG